jgi:hypothetical protein
VGIFSRRDSLALATTEEICEMLGSMLRLGHGRIIRQVGKEHADYLRNRDQEAEIRDQVLQPMAREED